MEERRQARPLGGGQVESSGGAQVEARLSTPGRRLRSRPGGRCHLSDSVLASELGQGSGTQGLPERGERANPGEGREPPSGVLCPQQANLVACFSFLLPAPSSLSLPPLSLDAYWGWSSVPCSSSPRPSPSRHLAPQMLLGRTLWSKAWKPFQRLGVGSLVHPDLDWI